MNQTIKETNSEVITLSDSTIQELIQQVRSQIHQLFKISESIATLDMLAAFAHLTTTCISGEYIRPELSTDSLMVKCGRHPIRAKLMSTTCEKFVPNDVYATPQNRFHIITGANMSGKSTYIRSIALMSIMAQIGCFVPAEYAAFPLSHELFARVSTDDNIDANVSTFASEMREIAFIIRNISHRSLVIIDELGRGTSTTDGLAIAIAIAETLINSKANVWFVTHFRDLPRILADRTGVSNLHLSVDISEDYAKMTMRFKILEGYEEEKFYGLALARVIGLPPDVLDTATWVSKALHERNEAKKRNSRATAAARRTKLILNLREQLSQARESLLDGSSEEGVRPEALRDWLKKLQVEFLVRLRAIDSDAEIAAAGAAAEADEIGEEMSDVRHGDGDPERQTESDLFETCDVDA
jgi:DNA mismatch repair protein MSH4